LRKLQPQPAWWLQVEAGYDDETTASNRWFRLKGIERRISSAVRNGKSPTEDRRKLIKYLTLFTQSGDISSPDRTGLIAEIAGTYEGLADYQRAAAKHFEIVAEHTQDEISLHALGSQYERLGDTNSALRIYEFMLSTFKGNTIGAQIGKVGVAFLKGATNDCKLEKPEWWDRYQHQPDWWSNVTVTMPEFSCFKDGFQYIPSGIPKAQDGKALAKAWTLLLDFSPITCAEKIITLRIAASAYSKIGDHHRAIEWAWQIPEGFSGDTSSSTNALAFIASEFDKLAEPQHAREIRNAIPCFSK